MQRKKRVVTIACVISAFICVLLILTQRWIFSEFANPMMEEIVYELSAPLQGVGNGMVSAFLKKCLLPAALSAAIIGTAFWFLRRSAWFSKVVLAGFWGSMIVSISVLLFFAVKVGFFPYVVNRFSSSDFIEKNYVDPANVVVSFPEKKRNLIYIYLESMETTYADYDNGGGLPVNHIPELTELAQEYEDFSGNDKKLNGGHVMPGSSWTVAAMFATGSGLPLKASGINSNEMSKQSSFFPGIECLGDILEGEGYQQTIMMGSDAVFGGRKQLYSDHGNFQFLDYPYALEKHWIPEDYKEFWGYEDEKLFAFAKDTLKELAEGDKPFNLTMLTVDTHTPTGYECRLCGNEFETAYENVIACSSRQTAEFIRWIQQQDFYKNTTIVVTGDHQTMAPGICDDLPDDYERKTYTCFINSAVQPEDPDHRRDFTTLDLFPTVLASIGCSIEGNRLGLGTNLFSSENTLSESYGFAKEGDMLQKKSEFLDNLETIDDKTAEAVQELSQIDPGTKYSVNYEKGRLYFTTGNDFGSFSDKVNGLRIKVWFYDDSYSYIFSNVKMEYSEDDKKNKGKCDLAKFRDADSVSYQLYANIKNLGMIGVGPEGTVTFDWPSD